MALPCPACKTPLGLNLEFIIKHPISVCPGCQTILDFTVNDEIKQKFSQAMKEIDDIKKKYKDIAKFG
jgi:transcription initiation factor IIE alpha subunit